MSNAAFRLMKGIDPGAYTFIPFTTKEVPRRLMHPKKKTVGVRIPTTKLCRLSGRTRGTVDFDHPAAAWR